MIKLVAAFALLCAFAPLPSRAGAVDATPRTDVNVAAATLTVTGLGEISRAPDVATVSVTIQTNAVDAARALSDNNRRFEALTAKLATIGVAPSAVTSTSLGSYYNPPPPDRSAAGGGPYGFIVTRNAQIAVADLLRAGSVIDAATGAGATQIDGVSYGFRDRRAVERAALAAAVADAFAQAQVIATAAHLHVERVLRIGNDAAPGRIEPLELGAPRAMAAAVPTSIRPSDLAVTNSVTITYLVR